MLTSKLRAPYEKSTVPEGQPPKWYEEDIQNYESKFELAVKQREEFKKTYLSHKDMSILSATNSNFKFDLDERHQQGSSGG